ncbi:MAG: hypothetical protein QOD75_4092 [Blastocatellia bacterium]|jgi:hypothetical protein|nr:hypothetical protein [Blastocatellia bacterium]
MLRKQTKSVRNSARSAQGEEDSVRVDQAADRVFSRRKGLLAQLAGGVGEFDKTRCVQWISRSRQSGEK